MALLIGVFGISGSGKTSLCNSVARKVKGVTVVSQDNFYKGLPEGVAADNYNFDDLDAIDISVIKRFFHISRQPISQVITIPSYDLVTHKRIGCEEVIVDKVILFEGHLVFVDPEIRNLVDKVIYVDVALDLALLRRIKRDVQSRGRDVREVLLTYEKNVRSASVLVAGMRETFDYVVKNDDHARAVDDITSWLNKIQNANASIGNQK